MNTRFAKLIPTALFALVCCALAAPLFAADTVPTHVSLLVGFPDAEAENAGNVLVSGTVIPVDVGLHHHVSAESMAADGARLLQLRQQLTRSLRLADVQFAYSQLLTLEVDKVHDLPGPTAGGRLSVQIELLGYNDEVASYQVRFFDRSTAIADSPVTVQRGRSSVVGGQDGDEAPYLFLVVAPQAEHRLSSPSGGPMMVGGDVTPPRVIDKPAPSYTVAAREARIQGVVIIQAIIDTTGAVTNVKVLKGLPMGLSEAAAEAISHWTFEPATLDGKPVEVYYNLTINFRLPPEEEES